MTREAEAAYRSALSKVLEIGSTVLRQGDDALDAIESVIKVMEDDPLFNAGRGAVFTSAGKNELCVHHGRRNTQCGCGRWCNTRSKSHLAGPSRHAKVAARDAGR